MILGILSDTHDRLAAATEAVKILRASGAEYLLHCGDVGGRLIIDQLTGGPAAFVWGNNDYDRSELAQYAGAVDVLCLDDFGDLDLGGKKIAITHGDDFDLIERVLKEQRHDYLFTGHTHVKHDSRTGRVRSINPGALYRAAQKSVAILDTTTDTLQFIKIRA